MRRLRAGMSHRRLDREVRHRAGHADTVRRHDLRLLRCRLLLPGRGAGHRRRHPSGPDDAEQGGRRERGPLVRQGSLRLRVRLAPRPAALADGPRLDPRRLARRVLGRGDRPDRLRFQGHPNPARRRRNRRHLVLTLHQRGGLRRPEDGASGFPQQQHRHVRPRVPLPHGLWPEPDLRHVGRHPGLRLRRALRHHAAHRGQPDGRTPRLRVTDEATPAGRRADHRRRSPPHRSGPVTARGGVPPPAAPAGDQRRIHQRDGARHRHRGTARRGVPALAVRERRRVPRLHRRCGELARGHRGCDRD